MGGNMKGQRKGQPPPSDLEPFLRPGNLGDTPTFWSLFPLLIVPDQSVPGPLGPAFLGQVLEGDFLAAAEPAHGAPSRKRQGVMPGWPTPTHPPARAPPPSTTLAPPSVLHAAGPLGLLAPVLGGVLAA